MTYDEVFAEVMAVLASVDDSEAAHAREDDLYRKLLASIADDTCAEPKRCAEFALTTQHATHARWCA